MLNRAVHTSAANQVSASLFEQFFSDPQFWALTCETPCGQDAAEGEGKTGAPKFYLLRTAS